MLLSVGLKSTRIYTSRMNSTEDWKTRAEEYLGSYQLGVQGKYVGISRMMKNEDVVNLSTKKMVANIRPRGVLSGFLVIVPNLGYAVFLPPTASNVRPSMIRMRCSPFLFEQGAIFSAYMGKENTLRIEDIIVWKKANVWATMPFEERWNILLKDILKSHFIQDPVLQKIQIELATYIPIQSLITCPDNTVIEFVPNEPKQKRFIYIVSKEVSCHQSVIAKKDVNTGPDVFTLWRSEEKLGYGLVRTLAMSKILRNSTQTEIPVKIEWNKPFGKWEIVEVLLSV